MSRLSSLTCILNLASLGALMAGGVVWLRLDLHSLLFACICWFVFIGKLHGAKWNDLHQAMLRSVSQALGPLFLFFLIGMIIGIWAESGTLACLIYYGLKILSVEYFLPATLLICSIMTLATGSAWGTVGTVGIALAGVGNGLGVPLPITAGAIISGACFGDKMSPVSDTTNLAALSAGTNLYAHIRGMMGAASFSFLVSLIMFYFTPTELSGLNGNAGDIEAMSQILLQDYSLSWVMLIPAALVIVSSLKKAPAELSMFLGIASAVVVSILFQGSGVSEVFSALGTGHQAETASPVINKILSRGGLQSMMWTVSLALLALALGGLLDELKILSTLLEKVAKKLQNSKQLKTTSILTAFIGTMLMAEAYLAILLVGKTMSPYFRQAKLDNTNLSRALEQGATLTTALIPWSTAGAYFSGVLGVSVLSYAPHAYFNWLEPLFALCLIWVPLGFWRTKAR